MSGKKKLFFALGTLALVVVVAAASVGITLAALSGKVTSTFNISYNALNVNADVEASYQVKNQVKKTIGTVNFTQESDTGAEATKTLNVSETIDLTVTDNYVDVTYKFTNKDETNDLQVSLNAAPSGITGLTLYYSADGSDYSSQAITTVQDITVNAGGTESVTLGIRFQIANNNNTVSAQGISLQWDLVGVAAAD